MSTSGGFAQHRVRPSRRYTHHHHRLCLIARAPRPCPMLACGTDMADYYDYEPYAQLVDFCNGTPLPLPDNSVGAPLAPIAIAAAQMWFAGQCDDAGSLMSQNTTEQINFHPVQGLSNRSESIKMCKAYNPAVTAMRVLYQVAPDSPRGSFGDTASLTGGFFISVVDPTTKEFCSIYCALLYGRGYPCARQACAVGCACGRFHLPDCDCSHPLATASLTCLSNAVVRRRDGALAPCAQSRPRCSTPSSRRAARCSLKPSTPSANRRPPSRSNCGTSATSRCRRPMSMSAFELCLT